MRGSSSGRRSCDCCRGTFMMSSLASLMAPPVMIAKWCADMLAMVRAWLSLCVVLWVLRCSRFDSCGVGSVTKFSWH